MLQSTVEKSTLADTVNIVLIPKLANLTDSSSDKNSFFDTTCVTLVLA